MGTIPLFPDFLMDTSRVASASLPRHELPWHSMAPVDADGNAWINAFQTNSVIVRGRSRHRGRVLTALAIVKDAHRVNDREAMEQAEGSIRLSIAKAIDATRTDGRATFYARPQQEPCRCTPMA